MKKIISQLVVALVCGLLGFLLTYQFKVLNRNDNKNIQYDQTDIISEIENLKKEKEELTNANTALLEQVKELEESAAKDGEIEGEIKKKLDNARMQLGLVEVKGPGIIITLTGKTSIFGSNATESARTISEDELVFVINTLWYSRAEAISINDFRITPQTGLKKAGNFISVGSAGRIDPNEKIVIKAIGDKAKLNVAASTFGTLSFGALKNYDSEIKQSDDIVITKTTQTLRSDYLNPVE